jgi:hypothetical protein
MIVPLDFVGLLRVVAARMCNMVLFATAKRLYHSSVMNGDQHSGSLLLWLNISSQGEPCSHMTARLGFAA